MLWLFRASVLWLSKSQKAELSLLSSQFQRLWLSLAAFQACVELLARPGPQGLPVRLAHLAPASTCWANLRTLGFCHRPQTLATPTSFRNESGLTPTTAGLMLALLACLVRPEQPAPRAPPVQLVVLAQQVPPALLVRMAQSGQRARLEALAPPAQLGQRGQQV